MDDLVILLIIAILTGALLLIHTSQYHRIHQEYIEIQNHFKKGHALQEYSEAKGVRPTAPSCPFSLSDYSLPISRSLWRGVEYVIADFIDPWFSAIYGQQIQGTSGSTPHAQSYGSEPLASPHSSRPHTAAVDVDFPNEIREIFECAFDRLGERVVSIDWSTFLLKQCIHNMNYLLRIYRLTEQECMAKNPFFDRTPPELRQKLLQAELLRTYTLHPAVTQPHAYLRKVSTALLSRLLRPSDFQCAAARTLTRELMTNHVLFPVMGFVTPYWINLGLVNLVAAKYAVPDDEQPQSSPQKSKSKQKTGNSPQIGPVTTTQPPSSTTSQSTSASTRPAMSRSATMEIQSTSTSEPCTSTSTSSSSLTSASTVPQATPPSPSFTPGSVFSPSTVTSFSLPATATTSQPSLIKTLTLPDISEAAPEDADMDSRYTSPEQSPSTHTRHHYLQHRIEQWSTEKQRRKQTRHANTDTSHIRERKVKSTTLPKAMTVADIKDATQPAITATQHSYFTPPSSARAAVTDHTSHPQTSSSISSTSFVSFFPSSILPSSSQHPRPSLHPPLAPSTDLSGHRWQVTIIGAGILFDPKPYVQYSLQVTNRDWKWVIGKRYNRFVELHARLKRTVPNFDAQMPKKSFFGNLSQQFIQTRKSELQTYLGQLTWNKNVQESAEFKWFLIPTYEEIRTQNIVMPSGFFASTPALTVNTFAPATSDSPPTSPYIGSLPRPGTSIIPRSSTEQRRTSIERTGINGSVHDDDDEDVDEAILSGSGPSLAPLSSSLTVTGGMKKSSSTPVLYTLDTEDEGVPNLSLQPSMGTVPITRTVSTPYPHSISSSTASAITSSTSSLSSTSTPATSTSMTLVSSNTQPSTQTAQASPQLVPSSSSSTSSSSTSSSSTSASSSTSSTSTRRSSSSHHFRFHLSEKDDSITAPLYVLVEELFALNTRGWMRRQATWVGKQIVKMTFNSAISTWINDSVAYFTSDEQVVANIDWIIDLIWPGGTLRSAGVAPTPEECETVAAQARAILLGSVPSSIRTLLGPKHCDESMRKFFDFLQMEPLVQHFAYSVLDTLVLEMFPELQKDLKS